MAEAHHVTTTRQHQSLTAKPIRDECRNGNQSDYNNSIGLEAKTDEDVIA